MDRHRPTSALFDVHLRLRPSATSNERFLQVEESGEAAPTHITIHPPTNDNRKRAVEKFAFTRVYEEDATQREVFESSGVLPVLEGVLGGRDGLVATLGVTGSGKSHTILGSKSQRGITQLTLDLLFQHTTPYLTDIDTSPTAFQSLCSADVSEAQILPAAVFLDSIYAPNENGGFSRATTPALVCDSALFISNKLPGAFPGASSLEFGDSTSSNRSAVYGRLYLSLAKYQPSSRASPSPIKRGVLTRSIAKLTNSFLQETSFLSAQALPSRRLPPRVSAMPFSPSVDDIDLHMDTSAEYAILLSMYEVHNDRIFDLLAASGTTKSSAKRRALLFKPTEASPDRKVVTPLRKIICSDLSEALLVLETGLHERRVAGTGSNATSSRSHGFFCIEVKKRRRSPVPGPWHGSTMTIVDLAGSERARTAKTAGATLAEAGKINESLMYLGQCMQMQSDNARMSTVHGAAAAERLVPFRQCKLTELLFSNSFSGKHHHDQQKAVMIVTADPHGDFNATSQILRYSALAREVAVPRIPSVTSTYLSGPAPSKSGRSTPSAAVSEDLDNALKELARLREELEVSQLLLQEETQRRLDAEECWRAAEERIEEVEAEIREEVFDEMEARMELEMRRWRAARDAEQDAQEEHLDRKLELLGLQYEGEEQENVDPGARVDVTKAKAAESPLAAVPMVKYADLEQENEELRERVARLEQEARGVMRSPSKSSVGKVRVLKPSKRWQGSAGLGLEDL